MSPSVAGRPAAGGTTVGLAARAAALAHSAVPLAAVVRGALVESLHHGHLVVTDPRGDVAASAGDSDVLVWPRSSLKPLQAVAMLQAGLPLDPDIPGQGEQLAVVTASHGGSPPHLHAVTTLLASAGLDESALRNTPGLPLDPDASLRWQAAGRGPSSVTQNCSGKHAGMLVTASTAGWDVASYLESSHPLQRQIRDTVADLTVSRTVQTTIDGCGAPLLATTLAGLARAFGTIAAAGALAPASPAGRVARAMQGYPVMVGGQGRDVTTLLAGLGTSAGLVAKDGAEGVYAAGLPDGRGVALKILDGGGRARPVLLAAALRAMGVTGESLSELSHAPVLGHGRQVGSIVALLPDDFGAPGAGEPSA